MKRIKTLKILTNILMFVGFYTLASTRTQSYYWANTYYGTVLVAIIVILSGIVSRMVTSLDKELNIKDE